MKKSIAHLLMIACALAMVTVLPSFRPVGGDSYTIYLNDQLLLQHYVYAKTELKPIMIAKAKASDVLNVRYSHCGKIGTARILTIKDEHNKVTKTIKYSDGDNDSAPMSIAIKDLPGRSFTIWYASDELKDGRMLASIQLGSASVASR